MVSVTVSLPFRGAFHLSLAVLVRYRSERIFRLMPQDGTDSHRVSCPVILGNSIGRLQISDTRLSLSLVALSRAFSYYPPIPCYGPTTLQPCGRSLASSLFARRYWGNHWIILFSSPYLDVSVQGVACAPLYCLATLL